MYETMRIPLSEITESGKRLGLHPFDKLSDTTKNLARLMASLYKESRQHRISQNDIRQHRGFRDSRAVAKAMYELESRGFGTVEPDGVQVSFSMVVPKFQSIE